ncbi:MAG: hypothetical protein NT013_08295 [Planctomycetia bacterium]|nr:hypothetical protein [Planctomycetia bacterium]
MQWMEFGDYQIQFDRGATGAAYKKVSVSTPEKCGCGPCLNWAMTRSLIIPVEFQELLHQFGIPLNGETEVFHNGKLASGLHSYGAWYHFVGKLLSSEREKPLTLEFGKFSVFFRSELDLLREEFKGQSVVQMDIHAEVPWLSNVPEENTVSEYLESLLLPDVPEMKSLSDAVEPKWFPELPDSK